MKRFILVLMLLFIGCEPRIPKAGETFQQIESRWTIRLDDQQAGRNWTRYYVYSVTSSYSYWVTFRNDTLVQINLRYKPGMMGGPQ
jgi:hypothetical protein